MVGSGACLPWQNVVHKDGAEDNVEERLERFDDVDKGEGAGAERHDRHALPNPVDERLRQDRPHVGHRELRSLAQAAQPHREDIDWQGDAELEAGDDPRQVEHLQHRLVRVVVDHVDHVPQQEEEED